MSNPIPSSRQTRDRVLAAVLLSLLAGTVEAQPATAGGAAPPPVCQRDLLGRAIGGPTAYTTRGTTTPWCEGFYRSLVSNVEVDAKGLVWPLMLDSARAASLDTVAVEWRAPAGSEVLIVAKFETNVHYRLDASVRTGNDGRGRWLWPIGVLQTRSIYPFGVAVRRPDAQVSVLALARFTTPAGKADSAFVPVRFVVPGTTRPPETDLELRMKATTGVQNPRVRLQKEGPGGTLQTVEMRADCPAPRGVSLLYVRLCLPPNATDGVYLVSVGAEAGGDMVRPSQARVWLTAAAR